MSNEEPIRINKFLSHAGVCSRRQADRLVERGKVTVNGKIPEMGTKVTQDDEIRVNGELIKNEDKSYTYLAFNKPVGVVCTTDSSVEKNNIVDYINYLKRIYPVGRLDKNSQGLILMTDDGEIVNKILRSRNHRGKEYIVWVDKKVTKSFIHKMGEGVPILDTVTKKCEIQQMGEKQFKIVLTQGLNRQIRRMCEYFGYNTVKLKRVRVINIELGDLPIGKYRKLTNKELSKLKAIISSS